MNLTISKQLAIGFASISLVLIIAVSFTIYEASKIDEISTRIVELRAPTAKDSSDMLTNIAGSLASLRGYMLTGSPKFKQERAENWVEIRRIEREMNTFSLQWTNPENVRLWREFKKILAEFEQYQRQVENVAHTPDDKPAQKILEVEAVPLVSVFADEITRMIELEKDFPATEERRNLLFLMADTRGLSARAFSNLKAFVLTGDNTFLQKFDVLWGQAIQRYEALEQSKNLLTPGQAISFKKYTEARNAFLPLPDKMIQIRNSDAWDTAGKLLVTEAAPRAEQLLALLRGADDGSGNYVSGIAQNQQELLLEDSDTSHRLISTLLTAEWILMVVGVLLASAIGIVTTQSVRRKEQALEDASTELAAIVHDLEVSSLKLNESHRLIEDAIESVGVGLIIYDKDDRFVICNSTHRNFYPEVSNLLVPNMPRKDIVRTYTSSVECYYDDAEHTHVKDNPSLKIRPKLTRKLPDGRWLQVTEQHTREGGVVAVRTDITNLKEQEEELVELAEKLELARTAAEAASTAKSNFLSTMSHEIRTPLNGVLGIAHLLKDTKLDSTQEAKVNTILSSGQTLLAIINDVLDMSKIEAGGLELEEKAFSLPVLISTITPPFQSLADDKGLDLVVKSRVESDMVVKGDEVRLRQILWNLLSNAIKFTDRGQIVLTIGLADDNVNTDDVFVSKKEHHFFFEVEDTGAGIAPDRLGAIFNAFTQEDNSISRKHGGTGLGLSIVKQLTGLMGGTIEAESELGVGTKFCAYIPFNAASSDEIQTIFLRSSSTETIDVDPLNIIIAEDNEVNAIIAKAFLNKLGHVVKHVANGKMALDAAQEGWADLILMDIHMPVMNGIEATKAIHATETGKNLPIIGLTAEAFVDRHAQFMEAGMADVLTKPYTQEQLADTLAANLLTDRRAKRRSKNPDPNETSSIEASRERPEGASEMIVTGDDVDCVGNEEGFARFCSALPDGVIADLLKEAQSSLQTHQVSLKAAVQDEDAKLIREAAHAIKGASGSMFATQVADIARRIEVNSQDIEMVSALMVDFDVAVVDTLQWWEAQSD